MTFEYKDVNYYAGKGHPNTVDPSGRGNPEEQYDDEKHGKAIVICTKRTQYCKNWSVYVKDYAKHLREYHNMEIDPVQERLMKQAAMIKPGIRKSKFVWAPFPWEIPKTLYDMHMQDIWREAWR